MKKSYLVFFAFIICVCTFCIKVKSNETSLNVFTEITASAEEYFESSSEAPNQKTYTISYGKGLYLSYNGTEPNNFIMGTPPQSQTVCEGGSVTVEQNTFTFRDYSFGGWKHTYTTQNGEKKTDYYTPGDVINNIYGDMQLEATWTKKNSDLKIDAFSVYAHTNEKEPHFIGELTVLKSAPPAPSDKHVFCGWTDNDGTVLYKAGDTYEIKHINTVIKPVWSVNGEQINYKKVTVVTNGHGRASISEIYLLSGTTKEIVFTANEGYFLSSVSVNGVSKGAVNKISVTVEEDDILIDVLFKEIYSPPSGDSSTDENEKNEFTINVEIDGEGGSSSHKFATVAKGQNLTITFTADENYRLPYIITDNGDIIAVGKNWDGKYLLEGVKEDHIIKISFIHKGTILSQTIVGDESDAEKKSSDSMGFTAVICALIIIFAIIFGIITLKTSQKTKKRKRNQKKKRA